MSARELAALLQARQISARDVMHAHLDRIARINPRVNAIVSKLPDETCLALADEADARFARGDAVGPLHGLPIAFKGQYSGTFHFLGRLKHPIAQLSWAQLPQWARDHPTGLLIRSTRSPSDTVGAVFHQPYRGGSISVWRVTEIGHPGGSEGPEVSLAPKI